MPDNSVTVVGNITRDPELRFTPNGTAVANFGIACNRRWMDRSTNEWKEETSFFNVTAWAEMAENAGNSLSKGDRIIVNGRLEQRSWETQEGDKRSVVEIRADEIGPSLRWATASVEKNERRGPEAGAGGGGAGGGATNRAVQNAPDSAPFDPAEEPF
jgi:single-strand DNA-binding protein